MKLKLTHEGRPFDQTPEGPSIPEKIKDPHKVRDHPIWCNEEKSWADPAYPGRSQHSSIELHYLYRTVLQLGIGNYANLGTFRGGSASCIAHGLKMLGGGKVYAVDIFLNNPHGSFPIPWLESIFEERGLSEYVEFCNGFTQEVVDQFTDAKFKYVFIDADHQYESVRQDFDLWSPLIEDKGLLILHDVDLVPIDRLIEEISDEWELVEHVWKLKSFKRRA